MENSQIRRASEADAGLITAIGKRSGDALDQMLCIDESFTIEHLSEELPKGIIEIYLYEDKGLVGLKKEFAYEDSCELYWIAVLERCHGQGIGAKLMAFIIQRARSLGFSRMFLFTHPLHREALKLYERFGFERDDEVPQGYECDSMVMMMRRRL